MNYDTHVSDRSVLFSIKLDVVGGDLKQQKWNTSLNLQNVKKWQYLTSLHLKCMIYFPINNYNYSVQKYLRNFHDRRLMTAA